MSQLNVGNIDRTLRIVFGLILIGLAAFGTIGAWASSASCSVDWGDRHVPAVQAARPRDNLALASCAQRGTPAMVAQSQER